MAVYIVEIFEGIKAEVTIEGLGKTTPEQDAILKELLNGPLQVSIDEDGNTKLEKWGSGPSG